MLRWTSLFSGLAFCGVLLLSACEQAPPPTTGSPEPNEAVRGDTTTIDFGLPEGSQRIQTVGDADLYMIAGLSLPEAVDHFKRHLPRRGYQFDSTTSSTSRQNARLLFAGYGRRIEVRMEPTAADTIRAFISTRPDETSINP